MCGALPTGTCGALLQCAGSCLVDLVDHPFLIVLIPDEAVRAHDAPTPSQVEWHLMANPLLSDWLVYNATILAGNPGKTYPGTYNNAYEGIIPYSSPTGGEGADSGRAQGRAQNPGLYRYASGFAGFQAGRHRHEHRTTHTLHSSCFSCCAWPLAVLNRIHYAGFDVRARLPAPPPMVQSLGVGSVDSSHNRVRLGASGGCKHSVCTLSSCPGIPGGPPDLLCMQWESLVCSMQPRLKP